MKAPGKDRIDAALARLEEVFPAERLLVDAAACDAYGTDSSRLLHPPFAVALPEDERQVAQAVRIAFETGVPAVARGRGTATTGASLAESGGFAIAFDLLDSIVRINAANRTATVQPGVLNGRLQEELARHGLFWPPDPGSAAYCSVGGNLATAAAGPRGIRYGGVRENVVGMRVVTGTGEIVGCGCSAAKCVSGYDLMRLVIGSEGTLALIVEAVVKLQPLPVSVSAVRADFADDDAALAAVSDLLRGRSTPAALEFVDGQCARLIADGPEAGPGAAMLLLQYEGCDERAGSRQAEQAVLLLRGLFGCRSAELRDPDDMWRQRRVLSQRLREVAPVKINEDVAVPVDCLAGLVSRARQAAREAGARCLIFGHAGVGNLHVNLLLERDDEESRAAAERALASIFSHAVECGGTISGEHGIGIAKRRFMKIEHGEQALRLMGAVKEVFDPGGILNPGKVIPASDTD